MSATGKTMTKENTENRDIREEKPLIPDKVVCSLADQWYLSFTTDMAGFSVREEEEFLLAYGPRKVRKAIKERRKAREQAALRG
jgi:hypothetical protein